MIRLIKDEKGVALIATLGVVAILLVLALATGKKARDTASLTWARTQTFEAGQAAWSGIHLALYVLALDGAGGTRDSVQDIWARPDALKPLMEEMGLDTDQVHLSITDEMGKIQINALLSYFPGNQTNTVQRELLQRFFSIAQSNLAASKDSGASGNPADPAGKVNALKDWLDSRDNDAVTGTSGAESDYYRALTPGYDCGNGPFLRLGQLGFVKGMESLSWSFSDFGQAFNRVTPDQVLTVFGLKDGAKKSEKRYSFSGRININTAPIPVLAAMMPQGLERLAVDLAEYRTAPGHEEGSFAHDLHSGWYKAIALLDSDAISSLSSLVTYSSSIYRADCLVRQNGVRVHLSAVIQRSKDDATGAWSARLLRVEQV